jgi:hypothetical protein
MTYRPVGIKAGLSSSSIAPMDHLDPFLFDGDRMNSNARMHLLSTISTFISSRYSGVNQWLKAWLAGSGASYRWYANPDLDVLLGIDFVEFRRSNPRFSGAGDNEIAHYLNDQMRQDLWPTTANWADRYEVTFYVNPRSKDIRFINPYAAYDLINDEWTVPPTKAPQQIGTDWQPHAEMYRQRAETVVGRYGDALNELHAAVNPAHRRDAEVRLHHAVDQAVAMFESVHAGRKTAFSPVGGGYNDFNNFLWQEGKRAGWLPALRSITEHHQRATTTAQEATYGLSLPDADVLVRRAVMSRL